MEEKSGNLLVVCLSMTSITLTGTKRKFTSGSGCFLYFLFFCCRHNDENGLCARFGINATGHAVWIKTACDDTTVMTAVCAANQTWHEVILVLSLTLTVSQQKCHLT